MARISNPGNTRSKIADAHRKIDENEHVTLAIAAVETAALRAREAALALVKGAKCIVELRNRYPSSQDLPAVQALEETFVSLSAEASKERIVAKGLPKSEEAKTVIKATNKAKSDAVMRWRDGAKRIKDLQQTGSLLADAVEQSYGRDAEN